MNWKFVDRPGAKRNNWNLKAGAKRFEVVGQHVYINKNAREFKMSVICTVPWNINSRSGYPYTPAFDTQTAKTAADFCKRLFRFMLQI